jgi:hypothetical protein
MCPPLFSDSSDDDNITIFDTVDNDRCTVCGGNFKHTQKYGMLIDDNGLRQVIFKTAHKGCLKIMARIRTKQQQITDMEYEIFLMRVKSMGL